MNGSKRWLADEFHTASCNTRFLKQSKAAVLFNYDASVALSVATSPLHFKDEQLPSIDLPVEGTSVSAGLEQTITARRSSADFTQKPLPVRELAKVLYLANGIQRDGQTSGNFLRNVANAGNLGSVELYCLVLNVQEVEKGLYRFDSLTHQLKRLKAGDYSPWLREKVFLQSEFADASVLLILTSSVERLCSKYGARGYRLALIDVGHVSQNIYLVATALSLNVCATGGFVDCELNQLLALDGLDNCTQLVIGISPK